MSKKIRVLLIDDHTILRQGIARMLNAEPDLDMRFHCGSVAEALLILGTGLIDLVLLDIDLGSERGIDFLAPARLGGFKGPVLVLTAGISLAEEEQLREYGISGVVHKNECVEQLAQRIRDATGTPPPAANSPEVRRLTERESAVLRYLVEGLTNKEIAVELGVSEAAVKTAMQGLFRKTGSHTRSHLVRLALEWQSTRS